VAKREKTKREREREREREMAERKKECRNKAPIVLPIKLSLVFAASTK